MRQEGTGWSGEARGSALALGLICTLGVALSAGAAAAPPQVQVELLLRTGDPAPDGGVYSALSTPVLDRDQVLLRAEASGGEFGVLRHRRATAAQSWALLDGELVPAFGVVDQVGASANPFAPAIGAHQGRAAVHATGAAPGEAALLLESEATGAFGLAARLGGPQALAVPGPWPPTGEPGWAAPPAVAAQYQVHPGPWYALPQPTRPQLFEGRVVAAVAHPARISPVGVPPGVHRALLRTPPAGEGWLKVADVWHPSVVASTPTGHPILRAPAGGWAGRGALVWRDATTYQIPSTGGGSTTVQEERLRVATSGAFQTLATATRQGTQVLGDPSPGIFSAGFTALHDATHDGTPVVDPAGARVAFWAQSQSYGLPSVPGAPVYSGVYRIELGKLKPYALLHSEMVVPGKPGVTYQWFSEPSLWGNRAVVTARFTPAGQPPQETLVVLEGSRPLRVLSTGDLIEGRQVAEIRSSRQAQHQDAAVAWVRFDDGGEAIALIRVTFPCAVDLTGSASAANPKYGVPDGVRNRQDLLYYEAQYAAKTSAADVTSTLDPTNPAYGIPDGSVTLEDWLWFRHHYYVVGCK